MITAAIALANNTAAVLKYTHCFRGATAQTMWYEADVYDCNGKVIGSHNSYKKEVAIAKAIAKAEKELASRPVEVVAPAVEEVVEAPVVVEAAAPAVEPVAEGCFVVIQVGEFHPLHNYNGQSAPVKDCKENGVLSVIIGGYIDGFYLVPDEYKMPTQPAAPVEKINKRRKYYTIDAATANIKTEIKTEFVEERQTIEEAFKVLSAAVEGFKEKGYKFPSFDLAQVKATHKSGFAFNIQSEWRERDETFVMLSTFCIYPGVE